MNFKDLAKKLKEIQDGEMSSSEEELGVGECGGMEMPVSMISPQQEAHADDSVNMNVTINSKGTEGIRDLMNILKGIGGDDHKASSKDDAVLIGNDGESEIVIGDDFKNAKHGDKGPKKYDLDSIIFTGDDLSSKGGEAVKQAGGGNPWKIRNESLVNHLSSLYEEVKGRSQKKR